MWTIYTLGLGKFGDVDLTGLWRYNTGLTYSLVATGRAAERTQQPRLPPPPATQNAPNGGEQDIFFGKLGSEHVPRLRRRRLHGELLDPGVEDDEALPEVRRAERVQQPEADCVRHDRVPIATGLSTSSGFP